MVSRIFRSVVDLLASDRWSLALAVALILAPQLIAAARGGARVHSGDEPHYLVMFNSLLDDGDFDLANNYAQVSRGGHQAGERAAGKLFARHTVWYEGDRRRRGPQAGADASAATDGSGQAGSTPPSEVGRAAHAEYPTHMIGLVLALAPVVFPLAGTSALEPVLLFFAGLATIGALLLFRWLLGAFTVDRRRINLATLVVFLATPIWPYARTLFMEPFLLLSAMGACAFAIRRRRGLAAGAFLGFGILLKPTFGLLLLPLLYGLRRDRRQAILLCVAPAVAVAFTAGLNFVWFGSPLRGQQDFLLGNPLTGTLGLLFDPGHGILLSTPIALLALAAWPRFLREHAAARLLAAAFLLQLALFACYEVWGGGHCYGPRYLVPVLPLLLIPLVSWGQSAEPRRGCRAWIRSRPLALGLVLVSLSINAPPAFFSPRLWSHHTYQAIADKLTRGADR